MAPDLNSLPPSHSPETVTETGRRNLAGQSEQSVSPSTVPSSTTGASSTAPDSVSPMQLPRQSPRAGPNMRINLHDIGSTHPTGETEPRRNSQHHLYRTSSQGRREGWTGSGLPSPRSPIAAAMAQGDPHHQRTPSLGELHQELEQEQEAQVNRLLQMIRQQQAQLQQLQSQNAAAHASSESASAAATSSTAVADDPQPTPPRAGTPSASGTTSTSFILPPQHPRALSPGRQAASHHSSPHSLRSRSRRSSRSSPVFATGAPGAPEPTAPRDEAAFYAAETQSLMRENQMLRARIRELERRVHDMEAGSTERGGAAAGSTMETGSTTESKDEENRAGVATAASSEATGARNE